MVLPSGVTPTPVAATTQPKLGRLEAAWGWLVPGTSGETHAQLRQARLLAGVSLALLLLLVSIGGVLVAVLPVNPAPVQLETYIIAGGAPVVLLALAINRRGHARAAAGLVLLMVFVLTWSPVLINRSANVGGTELLIYPIISIVLSGLLLPTAATAGITAGNLVMLIIVSILPDVADPGAALGPGIFYVGVFVLSGLASGLRARDQAQLDARERALAESETKYRRIVDQAQEGICVLDAANRTIFTNRRLAEMLGETEAGVSSVDVRAFLGDEAFERLAAEFRQPGRNPAQGYDIPLRRRDGSTLWAMLTGTRLTDARGQYGGVLGMVTDITSRKEAEVHIQQANEKLTALLGESEQRTRDMTRLAELGDMLQTSLTADEAYVVVAQLMLALFPGAGGRLYVMRESRNRLDSVAEWGPAGGKDEGIEPSDCWALRLGRVHVVQHLSPDLPTWQLPAAVCKHVSQPWPASYVCIPMTAQNEPIGLLHLQGPAPARDEAGAAPAPGSANTPGEAAEAWTDAQVRLARTVADSLSLALANLRLRETLRLQSIRDPLTGLYNRRYLEETLEREIHRARREQKSLGVMMLDIDHFKDFNDALGHQAGDQVLRAMGNLIASLARAEDVPCRYGGEEFIIILPGATLAVTRERAEAIRLAVRALSADFREAAGGGVTLSIGVAAYPEHGLTGLEVVRAADATLYQAKHAGRDQALAAGAPT